MEWHNCLNTQPLMSMWRYPIVTREVVAMHLRTMANLCKLELLDVQPFPTMHKHVAGMCMVQWIYSISVCNGSSPWSSLAMVSPSALETFSARSPEQTWGAQLLPLSMTQIALLLERPPLWHWRASILHWFFQLPENPACLWEDHQGSPPFLHPFKAIGIPYD